MVLDPSWTASAPAWTEVNSFTPTSSTWRTADGTLALGYQDFEPPTRVRTFLRFGLDSRVFGTHVLSATLRLLETWSPSCAPRDMEVWVTGGFSSSTTWNSQPTWGGQLAKAITAHGYSSSCPDAWLGLDVTSGIATAAKYHTSYPTFGLKATDESDTMAWKKFTPSGTNGPRLEIVYNHKPNVPSTASMTTSNPTSACVTAQASAPRVNITAANGITLRATGSDPDSGDKVKTTIQIWQYGGATPLASYTGALVASGTRVVAQLLKGVSLRDGLYYTWKAMVQDYDSGGALMDASAWSSYCWLRQDSTRPSPPEVSSVAYPTDAYAGAAGKGGVFTFAPGATVDTDIAGYRYGLDQPTPGTYIAKGTGASGLSAAVTLGPQSYGPHDLFVSTLDGAGNLSDPIPYHFYVNSPTDAVGYFALDEEKGTSTGSTREANPNSPDGLTGTLSGDVTWLPGGTGAAAGKVDGAVRLNQAAGSGRTGSISTSLTGAAVPTGGSFSVAVWVRLANLSATYTIVSLDGAQTSGFVLQFDASAKRWVFGMPRTDSVSAVVDKVVSSSVPVVGTWTHLAGTYDGSTLRLFGNGVQEASLAHTPGWSAAGAVQIGRGLAGGAPVGYLQGDVDDVRIYDRALCYDPVTKVGEVGDLVNRAAAANPAATWAFDESTGTTASDTSGNGRTANLGGGATFVAARTGNGLSLDGSTGYAATAAAVVPSERSITVAAWVKLASAVGPLTVASVDGDEGAVFSVQFRTDDGPQWVVSLAPAGTAAPVEVAVAAFDTSNAWVHVAGIYDSFTHQLRVRVVDSGGSRQARLGQVGLPWQATGAFQIGRAGSLEDDAVVYRDYLPGVVDDLRVYAAAVSEATLRQLAGQ